MIMFKFFKLLIAIILKIITKVLKNINRNEILFIYIYHKLHLTIQPLFDM